jgi:hypothetical protein
VGCAPSPHALTACCACLLTPNHSETLSGQYDLINNNLTPGVTNGNTVATRNSESDRKGERLQCGNGDGRATDCRPGESVKA